MLWEEMKKYTELTGEDAAHVPIMKIGAYLDGYEKGTEVLDKIRAEIENKYESIPDTFHHYETGFTDALEWVLSIIDKYKAEGSGEK